MYCKHLLLSEDLALLPFGELFKVSQGVVHANLFNKGSV